MLVKLTCEKGEPWYLNPDHVVSLIPKANSATMVVTDYESDRIHSQVVVLGDIDEVAAKLNGDDVKPLTVEQLITERRAGMAEAWFGAATHPGLPSDIADKFHMAARRMREPHAGN